MKRMTPGAAAGCLFLLVVSGCSVGMALSGHDNPDPGVVRAGASRSLVESELGSPKEPEVLEGEGRRIVYEYEIGDEASGGRAALHAVSDILTLGLWELVGTPVEASKGTTYRTTVTYGPDNTVIDARTEEVIRSGKSPKDDSNDN